jgi:hypothetical protein
VWSARVAQSTIPRKHGSVCNDRIITRARLGWEAKVPMRVYRSGHGARVSLMLAMTVLAVAAIAYGLGALEGWGRALAVGLAAGLLLTSSWVLLWVLRQNEERLRARALNDSLTDLPNRSSFVERVDRTLTRAAGESRSITVLLVDLDDFEEINHTLGHEAGDRLLAAVGERLGESVPPEGSPLASAATSSPSFSETFPTRARRPRRRSESGRRLKPPSR